MNLIQFNYISVDKQSCPSYAVSYQRSAVANHKSRITNRKSPITNQLI